MPYIPYIDPSTITDPEVLRYLEDAKRRGRPGPDGQAIRAHHPTVLKNFACTWEEIYNGGILEDSVKQLCRVYISKSIGCEY